MRRVVDEKLGLYLLAAHERDDEAHLVESRRGNHPDFQHILAGHNPARALDPQLIQHRIQEQEWRLDYPSARFACFFVDRGEGVGRIGAGVVFGDPTGEGRSR